MPVTVPVHVAAEALAETIRHAVSEGRYTPHSSFPSYRKLAKEHGVSIRTVQGAIQLLEKEGVLYRRERRGTFVRAAPWHGGKRAGHRALQCINFIEDRLPLSPAHLKTDYLAGYTEALEDHNVKMRFVLCPEEGDHYDVLLSDRFSCEQQGCIVVNCVGGALLQWLVARKISFVVQNYVAYPQEELPDHHSVFVNKMGGAFEATRYLMELGHRRIGFIGSLPGGRLPPSVYEGYRAALNCAGLEHRASDVMDFSSDEVQASVGPAVEFLRRSERPSAILAQSDSMAIGVVEAARRLGMGVPEDLSVVGFNDQPEAAMAEPALTTVGDPRRTLARTAVEILLEAAEGRYESYQTKALDCRVVARKTTAPPAA